jgi:predicted ATPase/transcriptional regulator with XRE-family HTH domain
MGRTMHRFSSSFAECLRQMRQSAGFSQQDLANRAGVSLRGISDLERGVRRTPHLTTVRLIADALALGPADRQRLLSAARPAAGSPVRHNGVGDHAGLPVPLTSLIGREREFARLTTLLGQEGGRLVTLVGTGGTGKTRLALEIGSRLTHAFGDGVVFVDLTPLRDANLVVPTIAEAVGMPARGGQPLRSALAGFLAPKQMLLLLDNCEHVLDAAPGIAALLGVCPRLAVLATSREALHVRGEREFPLLPLSLPEGDQLPATEDLARVPAITLFVERAVASSPGFALSADNAATVATICRRLDGLPLGIELCAARSKVLPPAAMLTRLENRLTLLTGGGRDLPARQRTMRDAIAWSYDLLTASEQALFRRLAIFIGGWTLEAAQAIGAGQDDLDVLDALDALVNASLVQPVEQPDGERRFGMLETVREFGMEQLGCSGEADDISRRHAHYFVALAQAGGAELAAATPGAWLTRLESERADLRCALTWLRDREETTSGLRLAGALGGFWRLHNTSSEGRAWLDAFLAQPAAAEAPVADRIPALRWAGELAGLEGDAETAEARLSESITLARSIDDTRGIAGGLGALGSVLFQHVDIARSIPVFEEAAALMRDLGDLRQAAFLLAYLGGAVGIQGVPVRAAALVAEGEALLRSLGDTGSFEANFVFLMQGLVALMRGDHSQAEERLNATATLGRALDSKGMLSAAFFLLGELALARKETDTAGRHFREGLVLGREVGFVAGMVYNLQGLVWLSNRHGAFARSARFLGAMEALGGTVQLLPGTVSAAREADIVAARNALGDAGFAAARDVGRTLPLAQIVAEATAPLATPDSSVNQR